MPIETLPTPSLTPELLSAIAGILLSLLASYCPGFSTWFERLEATRKRLVMLAALAAASAAIVALACSGLAEQLGLQATCDVNGAVRALQAFILALAANQSAYLISKG
jgi:hypothetical protein